MMSTDFRGLYTAIVTPFSEDYAIDKTAYEKHLEYQKEGGVDGIVVCGTTGESPTFSDEEFVYLVETAVEVASDRCSIIAGSGSNATEKTIHRSKLAEDAGADGLLVVAPYYNKPTQAGLRTHFRQVADATDLPVMLYNVPGRTSVNIAPETIAELAEHPNIVSVKEASADLMQVNRIQMLTPDAFSVLSGDDALTLPMMAQGCQGLVSVASNEAPQLMKELVDLGLNGSFDDARKVHYRLLPLMLANFWESNPSPAKAALQMMGKMGHTVRPPLVPMSAELEPNLRTILSDLDLI